MFAAGQSSSFTPANPVQHNPPEQPASAPAAREKKAHARVYQACERCRGHKTKCDRGDADAPSAICRRCLREGAPCVFASTRRRARSRDGLGDAQNGEAAWDQSGSGTDDGDNSGHHHQQQQYHSHHKRQASQSRPKRPRLDAHDSASSALQLDRLLTAGHLHVDPSEAFRRKAEQDEREMRTARDTLHRNAPNDQGSSLKALAELHTSLAYKKGASKDQSRASFSHPGAKHALRIANPRSCPERHQARRAWKRLSVVRDGLFSADEAINFVQKFYEHLRPLTPITIPSRYIKQQNHEEMISKDPILTITILAISSRYFPPSTPNSQPEPGADTRGYEIHSQLWQHCKNLMSRMFWAEENYASTTAAPISLLGSAETSVLSGSFKGLRSIETCNSLLLLTEWHTRGVHLPSNDQSNGLFLPREYPDDEVVDSGRSSIDPAETSDQGEAPSRRHIQDWVEPCHRSNRMCWSLITNAVSLAIEQGVFDSELRIDAESEGRQYCGRLLHIYMQSTSERLALKPALPPLPPRLLAILAEKDHRSADRPKEGQESHVLWHWAEVTRVLSEGNEELFLNKEKTRSKLADGSYMEQVKKYDTEWKTISGKLKVCDNSIVRSQRWMLDLELHYARVRINSIAMEAIFNRVATTSPSQREPGVKLSHTISEAIHYSDRACIERIVEASFSFLDIVEKIIAAEKLKYLPVRTFFRIVAVSTMLMRCFFMGLNQGEAAQTLRLLTRASVGLKSQVVDDLHVGRGIGELLEKLVGSISENLVKISSSTRNNTNNNNNSSHTPKTSPHSVGSANHRSPPNHNPEHMVSHQNYSGMPHLNANMYHARPEAAVSAGRADYWLEQKPSVHHNQLFEHFSVPWPPPQHQEETLVMMDWNPLMTDNTPLSNMNSDIIAHDFPLGPDPLDPYMTNNNGHHPEFPGFM